MFFPETATVFLPSAHPWEIIAARKHGPVVVLSRNRSFDFGECGWTMRVDNTFGQPSGKA